MTFIHCVELKNTCYKKIKQKKPLFLQKSLKVQIRDACKVIK